jgi:predicted nucleotide-binding protein
LSLEKKRRRLRPFTRNTLEEAIRFGQTIQDQNNGKPMKRIFIADHLKIKPASSNFKYLISASNQYGLTQGNEKSEYISLTPLGESIAKTKGDDRIPFLQEACQKVPVFQKFYQRYRDAKLPTDEYANKLLKDEFKVPAEHAAECFNLIITNGRFSGIIRDVAGAPYVVFETTPVVSSEEEQQEQEEEEFEETEEGATTPTPTPTPVVTKPKQIFIAHGKNTVPLEQLKKILDQFGKVPYKVAIDEPHRGRPISQKVADIMHNCSSAIFIFTADEEVTDFEGNKTYRPSDNVVYELGAAGVLYGKNIVIFKEQGVTFASDFSDLGYITFEKDNLSAKATDLLRELIEFGLLKITPA